LFGDNIGCISYHTTREEKTNERHLFALSYVFVELMKFQKEGDELNGIEDEWLFFLSRSEEVKEPPMCTKDEHILEAYKELERFNWSDESYDAYVRARLLLDGQEYTIDEARQEGIEKGKAEGIAIGTEKGKMEIAVKLLKKGMSISEVSAVTGLPESVISAILR
ncbi:Rpn family recombination-promoting nuclease/putative transposase, partial [Rickettsiales endosymbiont of Peranema trichophorum]|uniref:Rpn family recombination-promoting nuclease/putative transposase n=1 Tax=Rickettsiales endosymbiont of Peranema trichophorum TaxID=2486577 RepID=UPI0013EEAC52